jgi:hypothetical protein
MHLVGNREPIESWRALGRDDIDAELLGRLSLRELMAVCSVASLVVCDSTGVVHVAAALGTATVCFYCPRPSAAPPVWGALEPRTEAVMPPVSFCSFCSPRTGSCVASRLCDLAAGIDLAATADLIAAKAFAIHAEATRSIGAALVS